ncbi:thioredoxin domain-containing protein, partial [Pseudomonadota bacterium]
PMVPQLEFLLARFADKEDPELGSFLRLTLDGMAGNGMYDHVGDGFFRYSTDPGWDTPHFEKMLYDNAQLAVLYLRAGKLFGEARYTAIAERTLAFMAREMTADSGAMVASFSAVDEQGVEGGYYLWRQDELSRVLDEIERRAAVLAWDLRGPIRFEAGYLPKRGMSVEDISSRLAIAGSEVAVHLGVARGKLSTARSSRTLPVDTKLLAGWNGLALASFSEAARTTGDAGYRDLAQKIRDYIMTRLWDGEALYRAEDGGRKLGRASLEDYAYVSTGLRAWADLTRNPADAREAANVVDQAWNRFYDGGWRRGEASLIVEEPAQDLIADGPMPSPAAVVIRNTLLLRDHLSNRDLEKLALAALNSGAKQLAGDGFWHVSFIQALLDAGRLPSGE